MLFNSAEFVLFAAVFFTGWKLMRGRTLRLGWLTAASFFFYGWWDWRFLALLAGSGVLDFFCGLGMRRFPERKKLLLGLSLMGNVGSLAVFKYLGFLTANVSATLNVLGLEGVSAPAWNIVLPVGISFYTFQSMSYTIDIYRGRLEPTESPLHFFAYLSMFPQLVAGPIVRAADLLPQLEERHEPTEQESWDGWTLIAQGFFKKTVLADNLAPFVDAHFNNIDAYPAGITWWFISLLFAYQIYFDFSGYSNIARGLGHLMGLSFPVNFNHPYISTSFREFWGRWHISLSTWFRDYVYVPLGGNREGSYKGMRNACITMVVSGLWHGAAWTFVIWGALHAAYLMLERLTKWPDRLLTYRRVGGRAIAVLLVFLLTLLSWVFFRAKDLGDALKVLTRMTSPDALAVPASIPAVAAVVVGIGIAWDVAVYVRTHHEERVRGLHERLRPLGFVVAAGLLLASIYFRGPGAAFIYFQF